MGEFTCAAIEAATVREGRCCARFLGGAYEHARDKAEGEGRTAAVRTAGVAARALCR
jgi:hypothetical protein